MGHEEKIFVTAYLKGSGGGALEDASMSEVKAAREAWRYEEGL